MKKKTSRIEKEKLVVKEMIELYCKQYFGKFLPKN